METVKNIMFDPDALRKLLVGHNHWMNECEILQKNDKLVVYCKKFDCHLRYSKGPKQGFFWDIYGDDFHSYELALVGLSKAPMPFTPYVKFTLKLEE